MFKTSMLAFIVLFYGWCTATVAQEAPQSLVSKVQKIIPGIESQQITQSPIDGIYEVMFGMNVVYIDKEGRYIFKGDIIELESAKNITEIKRGSSRVDTINGLSEESMIIFSPEQAKYQVTVFTDVDCPYCRRLHSEVNVLNESGIAVRYLAFPRTGIPSPGYDKMVSVWCSDDPKKAMTDAKVGKKVTTKKCDNPVAEHYDLGMKFAIRGTPTIVLENGEVLGGYVPADRLVPKVRSASAMRK